MVKISHINAGDVNKRGSHPWVGNISWRRAWQCTPVFLPGESPWTEEPGRLQTTGSQELGTTEGTEYAKPLLHRVLLPTAGSGLPDFSASGKRGLSVSYGGWRLETNFHIHK